MTQTLPFRRAAATPLLTARASSCDFQPARPNGLPLSQQDRMAFHGPGRLSTPGPAAAYYRRFAGFCRAVTVTARRAFRRLSGSVEL
jgi:hypothetical protein